METHIEPLTVDPGQIASLLAEDVGTGDVTALIVPATATASATLTTREAMVLCGRHWFDAVFRHLDPELSLVWQAEDGDEIPAERVLCRLSGNARALLTGERTALNLLQTLSGTATLARSYARAVAGTGVKVLDTRKTVPGLRLAQKYAVRCGGCHNHRLGLFDAILIKENHILACGSIAQAVRAARAVAPGLSVEIEVETLDELDQALAAGVERILLDNFEIDRIRQAVQRTAGRAALEVSGNLSLETIRPLAETGVDYLSVGALTKNVRAVDLSLRIDLDL
ncbi:carboxylating nicotinate-nucleotide diphosphorylase [Methylotetracoccus oryzae]|uniref:carboxylating nicotinate-nucleotide diphosphorylase n=1 Tax=Methylotetracoccus oryzae TaxID=1919059 RepID=UPI001F33311A|nr:carboxylating nicotinate-nucleotide diphosphorylase [Methylotetracoccus oryzae]